MFKDSFLLIEVTLPSCNLETGNKIFFLPDKCRDFICHSLNLHFRSADVFMFKECIKNIISHQESHFRRSFRLSFCFICM